MAGDWIKMRTDLQTHPKIVRILSALRPQSVGDKSESYRVIGGLHAAWSVFDAHSTDGKLRGYTPDLLDHVIGWPGFARAMEAVGWLTFDGIETLALPEFEAHNGQSAKRRAEDQKRKKTSRQSVRNLSANDADKTRTREEKRREEKEQEQAAEITIPLEDGSEHPVTGSEVGEYRKAYPRIDVLAELRKARAWCVANPGQRKTRRGVGKFVNGWLSRADADAAKRAPQPARQRQQL
jgi:hypothetical protein